MTVLPVTDEFLQECFLFRVKKGQDDRDCVSAAAWPGPIAGLGLPRTMPRNLQFELDSDLAADFG